MILIKIERVFTNLMKSIFLKFKYFTKLRSPQARVTEEEGPLSYNRKIVTPILLKSEQA